MRIMWEEFVNEQEYPTLEEARDFAKLKVRAIK